MSMEQNNNIITDIRSISYLDLSMTNNSYIWAPRDNRYVILIKFLLFRLGSLFWFYWGHKTIKGQVARLLNFERRTIHTDIKTNKHRDMCLRGLYRYGRKFQWWIIKYIPLNTPIFVYPPVPGRRVVCILMKTLTHFGVIFYLEISRDVMKFRRYKQRWNVFGYIRAVTSFSSSRAKN